LIFCFTLLYHMTEKDLRPGQKFAVAGSGMPADGQEGVAGGGTIYDAGQQNDRKV
jgi:hypothetical protein